MVEQCALVQRFEPRDGHEGFFIAKFELLEALAVEPGTAVEPGGAVEPDGAAEQGVAVNRAVSGVVVEGAVSRRQARRDANKARRMQSKQGARTALPTTAPRSTVLPTTALPTTALLTTALPTTTPARAPAGAEQSKPLLRPTTPTTAPLVRWFATLAVIGGVAAAAGALITALRSSRRSAGALITALRSYRARGGGAAWHWW
jgi:hypothetical protein